MPEQALQTVPLIKKKRRGAAVVVKIDRDPQVIVRLMPSLDEAFRDTVRYRGDVSTGIVEALKSVDLSKAAIVDLSADKTRLKTTTARIPEALHERCKLVAEKRGVSMNELFNTALAHWLAGKKLIKLG